MSGRISSGYLVVEPMFRWFALFAPIWCCCGFLSAQEYVLDEMDFNPPQGSTLIRKSLFEIKDAKVLMLMKEQNLQGKMSNKADKEEQIHVINPNKVEYLVVNESQQQSMTLNGQVIPMDPKEKGLQGIKLKFEEVAGTWVLKNPLHKFSEHQKELLKRKLESINSNGSPYGYEARKVGETWKIDPNEMADLFGSKDLKGTMHVTLLEIVQKNGMECAKCRFDIDVKGKFDDAGEIIMALKGTVVSYRSLAFFFDLESKGELDTVMSMPLPGADAEFKITGKAVIAETNALAKKRHR